MNAGLTQRQLADRIGVSQPVLARLESTRSNPRFATLRRVIAATGKQLDLGVREARAEFDESMIASNLQRSPAERLAAFAGAYRNTSRLVRTARS